MRRRAVGDEAGDGVTADEVGGLKGPAMEEAIVLSSMSFQDRKSPSPVPSNALPVRGSFPATCSATMCLPLYQYNYDLLNVVCEELLQSLVRRRRSVLHGRKQAHKVHPSN